MSLSKPEFTCEECGKTCSNRSSLNKHKIFHESPQYQCIQCDKHFHTKWHLKRHVITHTGDSNHVCDVCGTRFVCGFNLKRHTKSVHMEEKNHKCDICNKHFRRKEYLDAHALKHSGENPHHCLVFNKSFSVKRYLKKHVCTKEPKLN